MKNIKLNVGCGKDIKEGYDNVDIKKGSPICHNLDEFPYTFSEENTYEYVLINLVLEYLDRPEKTLNEIWRLCKPKAIVHIRTSFYFNKGAYKDMNVRHWFSDRTFEILAMKNKRFELQKINLVPTTIGKFIPTQWFKKKLSLLSGIFVAQIEAWFIVIKD